MNSGIVGVQESNFSPKQLISHQVIGLHMIFDIKLGENFQRKAITVAGDNNTKTPSSVRYISVVLRDSVKIMLMIEVLNNLDL